MPDRRSESNNQPRGVLILKKSMLRRGLLLATALVPSLVLTFPAQSLKPIDPEPYGGRWIESPVQDCAVGRICVIWELSDGSSSGDPPCCVRASLVNAGDYAACGSSFRHLH